MMQSKKEVFSWNSKMCVAALIGIGLAINIFFLLCMAHEYHAISMAHGNVAFNLYRYNNPGINSHLTETMFALQDGKQELIDFSAVRDIDRGPPDAPFPVNDTIGYGVLLGLLWKITHSLSFTDIIFLQIFMYLIMIYLIYQIGYLLFTNKKIACYATIAFLCYLPLIALNVHAVRDVWAAYGIIVLLYVVLAYIKNKGAFFTLLFGCIFFTLCQWIRPSLFVAVATATVALIVNMVRYIYRCDASVNAHHERKGEQIKKTCTIIATLWIINLLLFWWPFMQHNKTMHGRYMVSPAGQDLLEGLGEFANPWDHQLSDEYVAQLIKTKYGTKYGTPQFDDDAKKEFLVAYHEYSQIFWKNIIKRMPMIVLPALPWIFYIQSPYAGCINAKEKIVCLMSNPSLWIDLFARHIYMRLYILLGYLGLLVLLWRRKYGVVLMISAVLLASMAKLPSHIEYRYLTPYYWVLCFAIGYGLKGIRSKK